MHSPVGQILPLQRRADVHGDGDHGELRAGVHIGVYHRERGVYERDIGVKRISVC